MGVFEVQACGGPGRILAPHLTSGLAGLLVFTGTNPVGDGAGGLAVVGWPKPDDIGIRVGSDVRIGGAPGGSGVPEPVGDPRSEALLAKLGPTFTGRGLVTRSACMVLKVDGRHGSAG